MRSSGVRKRSLVTAAVLVCACHSSPDAAESVESVASWNATASMLAQRWYGGAAPSDFTTRALGSVHQELVKERSALHGSSTATAAQGALDLALTTTARSVALLQSAVAGSDSAGVVRLAAELQDQRKTLLGLRAALER